MKKLVKNEIVPAEKVKQLVELEKQYKEIKTLRDSLKAELLNAMQVNDVLNLRTGTYTLYRAKRITPRVADLKKLKESLDKAGIPYITEEVFAEQMKPVFKTIVEEGRDMEGLDELITEYVGVRVK